MELSIYQKWAEDFLVEKNLSQLISVSVMHDEKFKVGDDLLLGKVLKANAKWRQANLIEKEFLIIVDEDILTAIETQYGKGELDIAMTRIMNSIAYDYNKDEPILTKPDFVEYSGVLKKYGHERLESHRAAISQAVSKD